MIYVCYHHFLCHLLDVLNSNKDYLSSHFLNIFIHMDLVINLFYILIFFHLNLISANIKLYITTFYLNFIDLFVSHKPLLLNFSVIRINNFKIFILSFVINQNPKVVNYIS